jgi:hypothetical protein
MNAVINRITRTAERVAPNLRTWGAKLRLARAITAAIPAHCNESVSVTRTTAALAWRMKIMCKGREFHLRYTSIARDIIPSVIVQAKCSICLTHFHVVRDRSVPFVLCKSGLRRPVGRTSRGSGPRHAQGILYTRYPRGAPYKDPSPRQRHLFRFVSLAPRRASDSEESA